MLTYLKRKTKTKNKQKAKTAFYLEIHSLIFYVIKKKMRI